MASAAQRTTVVAFVLLLAAAGSGAEEKPGSQPTPVVSAANAPAVIKRLEHRIQVEADGRASATHIVRVLIREQPAVQALGHIFGSYLAGHESVALRRLVVEKPDGQRVTVNPEALVDAPTRQTGAFDAPSFHDTRMKQVTVPALAVGDTLEYEVARDRHTPFAPGHYWTEYDFPRDAVVEQD